MRIAQMNIAEAFRILGFDHAVERDEVKASYKELMRLYHPDVNPELYEGDGTDEAGDSAKEALLKIQEAYALLMKYYDETPHSIPMGIDPSGNVPSENDSKEQSRPSQNYGQVKAATGGGSTKVFGSQTDLTEMRQRRKNKAAHIRQEQRAAERAREEKQQREAQEKQHRQTKAYEEAMTKIHTQRAAELTAQIIEAYLRNGENLAGE